MALPAGPACWPCLLALPAGPTCRPCLLPLPASLLACLIPSPVPLARLLPPTACAAVQTLLVKFLRRAPTAIKFHSELGRGALAQQIFHVVPDGPLNAKPKQEVRAAAAASLPSCQ